MRKLILICYLSLSFGNARAQVINDTVRVANHARSSIARVLNICRTKLRYKQTDLGNTKFPASTEISFFKQTLKNKLLYNYDVFRCFGFSNPKKKQHLEVSEFIYKNKALANKVFKYLKLSESSSLSEVYIKFKPVQIGNSVFIVLSETPDDAGIENLFNVL